MSGHDGPDISAVYHLLSEVARIVAGHDRRFDAILSRLDAHDRRFDKRDRRFDEHTGKLNELIAVANGHSSKLDELAAVVNAHDRKFADLSADLAGLRETLTHYHASVLGHGILISELEERVRRIERHLRLEPASG
jgi:ABC-type transporter Mla subunit MlaD